MVDSGESGVAERETAVNDGLMVYTSEVFTVVSLSSCAYTVNVSLPAAVGVQVQVDEAE